MGDTDQRLIDFTRGGPSSACQAQNMFVPEYVESAIKDQVESRDTCTPADRLSQRLGFMELQHKAAEERKRTLSETSNPPHGETPPLTPDTPHSSNASPTDPQPTIKPSDAFHPPKTASDIHRPSDTAFKSWLELMGIHQRTRINSQIFERARGWIEWLPDPISNFFNSHFR